MSRERAEYRRLCDELAAEEDSLDAVVAELDEAAWANATPAQGWDVRDQIGHLAVSEDLATLAASDPQAFRAELARMLSDPGKQETELMRRSHEMTPPLLIDWWRKARAQTVAALLTHEPTDRLPWASRDMSATSFTTARLMETWAHGQDIVDAIGVERIPTDRLYNIAILGILTRRFSYINRGLEVPIADVRVELLAPSGRRWVWGDHVAPDRIVGTALDFCLVVTQRRSLDDTALDVTGDAAIEWMGMAQVFAGPPTAARLARSD